MTQPAQQAEKLRSEPEAERELIASLMYRQGKQPPKLAPSRFISERHRQIWAAIIDLHRKGLPYDVVSVVALLRERGQFDSAGKNYIAALDTHVGTADSLEYYADLIRRAAAARALGPLGHAIAALSIQDDQERPEASLKARYQTLVRRADAVCDMASRNGHAASLTVRTPMEIMSMPTPLTNWIYEPWLGAGDIVIMAGEPGLGKSWVAQDLMFALALALDWAGVRNSAGPQRVLYVDEENNFRLVRHRIGKLVDGMNLLASQLDPAVLGAAYAMEQGINLDDAPSLELLKRKLDQLRPDWVILDSMTRIHHRDENSNSEMASLLTGLIKPLVRNIGAGAIIIHHLGKATKDRPDGRIRERIRGASDIIASVDQAWGLERDNDALTMTHIKCRYDRESGPVAVQLEDVNQARGIKVQYSQQEVDSDAGIKEILADSGTTGTPRPAIVNHLIESGIKAAERTASRQLGIMHSRGIVKKAQDGKSVRYWLTEYSPSHAT